MLYEDNYLAHYGIKGQRWGIRRFQNEDGTLTSEGKKHYRQNNKDNSLGEETDKALKEKAFNEGTSSAKTAIRKMENESDPDQRSRNLQRLFKEAYDSLGVGAGDTTYPGYDENKDPKQQAYNIELCRYFDKKIKSIYDPLGLTGRGDTDGHTPGTKAISDKMKANIDKQDEIYEQCIKDYYKRKGKERPEPKRMSLKDFWNIHSDYEPKVHNLKKEYANLELVEMREQICKDLGIPATKENMSFVYAFLYGNSFYPENWR